MLCPRRYSLNPRSGSRAYALNHLFCAFQNEFCWDSKENRVMKFIFENKHSVIHVENNVGKHNLLPAE